MSTTPYIKKRDFSICDTVSVCATTNRECVEQIFDLPVEPVSATIDLVGVPAVISASESEEIKAMYRKATMAIIAGIVIDKFSQRWIQILGMIVGTAICYAFGTAWFCIQAGYTVSAALAVCVIPFIPADLIKMVIAMIIGPEIRKRLGAVAQ